MMKMEKRDAVFELIVFLGAIVAYSYGFLGNAADPNGFQFAGAILLMVLSIHQIFFLFWKKQ